MHPAKSVIAFTTLSGAGYGMLFLLGLGFVPEQPALRLLAFAAAFALIGGGLLSSTLHLGHPERAWRALSQWRTSWLSREGVLALWCFLPGGAYGALWVFAGAAPAWLGWLTALSAAATVHATGMIYAVLKPVHHWHTPLTPLCYLALALASGATALAALLPDPALARTAMLALAAGLILKGAYWWRAFAGASPSTPESATGLGFLGRVRLIEGPHTQSNYLLREMGFRIARQHAAALRVAAMLGLGLAVPALLLEAGWAALILAVAGVVAERTLFFAEARHAVTLYYGAPSA